MGLFDNICESTLSGKNIYTIQAWKILITKKTKRNKNQQTHLFRRDASRHTLSGSMPALSFSWATMNMPRSRYVVYSVKNTIIAKYV